MGCTVTPYQCPPLLPFVSCSFNVIVQSFVEPRASLSLCLVRTLHLFCPFGCCPHAQQLLPEPDAPIVGIMLPSGIREGRASHTATPTFAYDLADKPSPPVNSSQSHLSPGYFDLHRPQFPAFRRRSSLRLTKRQDEVSPARESPSPLERPRPFSFMKMRHASDPQLSTRFKDEAPAITTPAYDAAPGKP